ncbi:MAG TPA: YifB family Mg chelatase-like AAA ATPase [Polyangiales bacterium]
MHATVHSATLHGIDSVPVEVQAFFGKGLPGVDIVGLGDTAVRESRVRVRSALESSGLSLPSRHVVLNLAPADVKKTGSALDLPIALALFAAASEATPARLNGLIVLGELALSGELRPVRGVLSHLRAAWGRGFLRAVVPMANAGEASLVNQLDVRCASTLKDVVQYLLAECELPRATVTEPGPPPREEPDLSDVRGQRAAKRALEVAAAGGHNLLMLGPPGTGKTMLARRLGSILPAPAAHEALEIATIASAAGVSPPAQLSEVLRPFRAPHHSASHVSLIGGGHPIRPGEVTLAHGGVLFLDELPEFSRATLESLRPTMESGLAVITRAHERVVWPAQPLVVAAMNPCPCGYADDAARVCSCSIDRVERYRARISGPLLDRFDMHIALKSVESRTLREGERGESSAEVRARVCAARALSGSRVLGAEQLSAQTEGDALCLLDRAVDSLGLSVRAYVKALRVARTIAHLDGSARICAEHVAEAIQYRLLDRSEASTRPRYVAPPLPEAERPPEAEPAA